MAGFENHAGRTILDAGAEPLGRVVAGFGNDGESGYEGCRVGSAIGTYLHGPLLPRNPWLADWLLAQALAHRSGERAGASSRSPTSSSARRTPSRPTGPLSRRALFRSNPVGARRSLAPGLAARALRVVELRRPERAEIDGRVARPPAREEALDRRVEHDVVELVEPNSRWPRTAASSDVTRSSDRPPGRPRR